MMEAPPKKSQGDDDKDDDDNDKEGSTSDKEEAMDETKAGEVAAEEVKKTKQYTKRSAGLDPQGRDIR